MDPVEVAVAAFTGAEAFAALRGTASGQLVRFKPSLDITGVTVGVPVNNELVRSALTRPIHSNATFKTDLGIRKYLDKRRVEPSPGLVPSADASSSSHFAEMLLMMGPGLSSHALIGNRHFSTVEILNEGVAWRDIRLQRLNVIYPDGGPSSITLINLRPRIALAKSVKNDEALYLSFSEVMADERYHLCDGATPLYERIEVKIELVTIYGATCVLSGSFAFDGEAISLTLAEKGRYRHPARFLGVY